jgi:uncharacterized PurR-regulated membrane protein YhhQ (DUF165 family)
MSDRLTKAEVDKWVDKVLSNNNKQEKKMEKKWMFAIGYIISIVMANFFVAWFGIVNYFGLMFPAGAVFIGLTFSLRDFVQREWGHAKCWYFMIASLIITSIMGAALSHLPIPLWKVALASGVAFIVSEAIDWLVFYLMKKDIIWRICISNIFSTPIDSILFVGIAFGSWSFLAPPVYGQAIVKYVSGLLVIPIIIWSRNKYGIQRKPEQPHFR